MFGRKSEEQKEAERLEVEEVKAAGIKKIAEDKAKRLEAEERKRIEKEENIIKLEKEKNEAVAKAAAIEAERLEAIAKKKADYINEKSKLTEKELLAEILWSLSRVENSPTIDTEDYQKRMLEYQDGLETSLIKMEMYLKQMEEKLYEINVGVRADRISEPAY